MATLEEEEAKLTGWQKTLADKTAFLGVVPNWVGDHIPIINKIGAKPAAAAAAPKTAPEIPDSRPVWERNDMLDQAMMGGPLTAMAPQLAAPAPIGASSAFDGAANSSYAAAMGAIESKFGRALGEIARREAAGKAAIAAMPKRLDESYARGQQAVTDFVTPLAAAGNASIAQAPGVSINAQAGVAPIQAAMQASLAERQADVPLLGSAVDNYFGGLRTQSAMAQADQIAQIKQAQAGMQHDTAMTNARLAQDAAQFNAGQTANVAATNAANQHDVNMAQLNAKLSGKGPAAMIPGGVSIERAQTFTPKRMTELRGQKAWKDMQADYTNALATNPDTAVQTLIAKWGASYPDTTSLFLATIGG